MSTDIELNNDYFMYVCTYIYKNNNDATILDGTTNLFTLVDLSDGKGVRIRDWNVPDVKQPTVTQLKNVAPNIVANIKKMKEINRAINVEPKLITIFRDIYNKLPNNDQNTFPTDASMISYLKTLF